MAFTVGQLAKLTGLTVRALHHYDAIGLLTPSQRSDAGYRLYTDRDVVKLFRIQALRGLGLSLDEVATALERQGAALPRLLERQVTALNSQIEQASTLRARLTQLQQALTRGSEPAAGEWLDAVEMITVYERRCSPEELGRLLEHNTEPEQWRELIDDMRAALKEGVPPSSARAGAFVERWSELTLRSVGGDIGLALKVKLAYAEDPGVQTRMAMQSGLDAQVLAYLGQAAFHKHLTLWSRHLSEPEAARLRIDGAWNQKLVQVIAALRQRRSAPDAGSLAAHDWDRLLDETVGGDADLRRKVERALASDPDLQRTWILDADLLQFIQRPNHEP